MSGKYRGCLLSGCALEGTGHAYSRSTKELARRWGSRSRSSTTGIAAAPWRSRISTPSCRPTSRRAISGSPRKWDWTPSWRRATVLSQSQGGRIRPQARSHLAGGQRPAFEQGRSPHLRGRQGRAHPCARLNQRGNRRRGPEGAREELAQGPEGANYYVSCTRGRATSSPKRIRGRLELTCSRISWTTSLRRRAPRMSSTL